MFTTLESKSVLRLCWKHTVYITKASTVSPSLHGQEIAQAKPPCCRQGQFMLANRWAGSAKAPNSYWSAGNAAKLWHHRPEFMQNIQWKMFSHCSALPGSWFFQDEVEISPGIALQQLRLAPANRCLHHPLWPSHFKSSCFQMLSPVPILHWQTSCCLQRECCKE